MSPITITITMSETEGATIVGTPAVATLSSSGGVDDAPPDSAVSDAAAVTGLAADDADGPPPVGLNELGLSDDSETSAAIGDDSAPEDIHDSADAEEDDQGEPEDV